MLKVLERVKHISMYPTLLYSGFLRNINNIIGHINISLTGQDDEISTRVNTSLQRPKKTILCNIKTLFNIQIPL